MKMSGADFKAFINSKDPAFWPEDLYIEDESIRVNGGPESELDLIENYKDSDIVEIVGGALAWNDRREDEPGTLVALARRWLKAQNETRVVISVPKDKVKELAPLIKQIGASVCK